MSAQRTIRLLVEYDGTAYAGWQRQENGRSIQGEIETALAQILRETVSVAGAGRTDAGVHARGQVASFTTSASLETHRIARGLTAVLPDDIVVREALEAPEGFHARFSAKGRRYTYLIATGPTALLRRYSWHVKQQLDAALLHQAAAAITRERDFRSFCRAEAEVEHFRCAVTEASWAREGDFLRFTIRSDRFLHGMVRALVGTMVEIARGYRKPEELAAIFAARDRSAAGAAAPPSGLVLEEVYY